MNSIQTTKQLQQCIILANTPSSDDSTTASSMLDEMCSRHDAGSKLCTALLKELLSNISESSFALYPINNENQPVINILFYSLTTIQRALAKDADERNDWVAVDVSCRDELRQIVFQYMLYVNTAAAATNRSSMATETQTKGTIFPKFIRTKIGVVLALLIQADFPERWPTVFNDLIQTMNFGTMNATNEHKLEVLLEVQRKEIFVRAMDAVCDEVVDKAECEKNKIIKDIVRGFVVPNISEKVAPESSISAMLIESLFRIYQWSYHFIESDQIPELHELRRLPVKAISALKRFISWVELSLILNESIISMFFSCLASAGPGDDDDRGSLSSQLAVQVVDCLKEIVNKGMENSKKISLIMNINILDRLSACNLDLIKVDGTHITIVIGVAELINSIGCEMLMFWGNEYLDNPSYPDLNVITLFCNELGKLVNLFFYLFAYDDIDVSGSVIPLAISLVAVVEKEQHTKDLPFKAIDSISQLMSILYNQMQHPSDFQFDYEDEEEAEEEMYRSELRKLNQAITRICPNESLQFICNVLADLEVPLSSVPTPTLEAALRLVYHYCEGIRPIPGIEVVLKNTVYRDILISLHSSDCMYHSHREVVLLYYDISIRYSKLLKERTDLLPNLLNSLTGVRGIQHTHCRVRNRSCYFLLKLVKTLGKTIRPFVEVAIKGIMDLISNESTLTLDTDDKLNLFETVGLLLGKSGLDEAGQHNYLTAIIAPQIQRISSLTSDPNLPRDPEYFAGELSSYLAILAFVSKGFSKKTSSNVRSVLSDTVPIVLVVLQSLPNQAPIRDKIMIYLQRMILCLGNTLLPSLANFLNPLIRDCTNEDILDVAQLLNQICFKFKQNAVPCIDVCVLPFLEKCQSIISNLLPDADEKDHPPHIVTEKYGVLKIMYAFLYQIVSTQCTAVLLSPTNISALEYILGIMGDGATSINDPIMKKTCVQFFRTLIKQWLSTDNNNEDILLQVRNGFEKYVLRNFLPGMLICFNHKEFNDSDAIQYRVLREVAAIMSDLKTLCKNVQFEESFQSASIPGEIQQTFGQAQQPAEIEKWLKAMMASMK